jgi:hemerythrin superfamily protein
VDAITLLKDDHKTVEGLFKRYERAGDRAYATKRKLADSIIRELSVHAAIEEQLFYPAVRARVEAEKDDVLEALEEHHLVKLTLAELEDLDPKDERFDAKVTVLMESVRHHVKEEEQEMFPKVRKSVSRADLQELGELMAQAKRGVPTRPHPGAPDEPPGNAVAGLGAVVYDLARDAASGATRAAGRAVRRATN